MLGISVVMRDSDEYTVAAATWCVEALPYFDIGKALGVRLAIQLALDIMFF